jgi:hypothetical protein
MFISTKSSSQEATSILSYGRYTDEIKSIVFELWELMEVEDIERPPKSEMIFPFIKAKFA